MDNGKKFIRQDDKKSITKTKTHTKKGLAKDIEDSLFIRIADHELGLN